MLTVDTNTFGVSSYTLTESAMPSNVVSTEGGVYTANYELATQDWLTAVSAEGRNLIYSDAQTTTAKEISMQDFAISIQGLGLLESYNRKTRVYNQHTTIKNYLTGLRPARLSMHDRVVTKYQYDFTGVPTFVDNAWLKIKQFASAFKLNLIKGDRSNDWYFDVQEAGDTYDFSDWGLTSVSISSVLDETADVVNLNYYKYTLFPTETEVFPKYSESTDVVSISASSGESVEVEIRVNFAINEIVRQPTALYTVDNKEYITPVYSVVGNDDLPIQPAQLRNAGCHLQVSVKKDDPQVIVVNFTAPNIPNLSPFRVAMSSGDGVDYNSLHVLARGASVEKHTIPVATGIPSNDMETREVEVDNPYVCSPVSIGGAILDVARHYSGRTRTISFGVPNRGQMPKQGDFVLIGGTRWRILTASTTPDTVTYTGEEHYRIDDFDNFLGTMTIDDLDKLAFDWN